MRCMHACAKAVSEQKDEFSSVAAKRFSGYRLRCLQEVRIETRTIPSGRET